MSGDTQRLDVAQSSMSEHFVFPEPEYPLEHALHMKPVFGADTSEHLVSWWHGFEAQPSVSLQVLPSPEKPAVHVHEWASVHVSICLSQNTPGHVLVLVHVQMYLAI